jgi:hypothetical protein
MSTNKKVAAVVLTFVTVTVLGVGEANGCEKGNICFYQVKDYGEPSTQVPVPPDNACRKLAPIYAMSVKNLTNATFSLWGDDECTTPSPPMIIHESETKAELPQAAHAFKKHGPGKDAP